MLMDILEDLRVLMDILEDLIMLMDILEDGQVLEKQASEIKKLTRQLETMERAGYKLKEYWSEKIYRRALCRSLGDRLHITLADVVAAREATCQAACPGQPVEGMAPPQVIIKCILSISEGLVLNHHQRYPKSINQASTNGQGPCPCPCQIQKALFKRGFPYFAPSDSSQTRD